MNAHDDTRRQTPRPAHLAFLCILLCLFCASCAQTQTQVRGQYDVVFGKTG